jgi:hypothetical protein
MFLHIVIYATHAQLIVVIAIYSESQSVVLGYIGFLDVLMVYDTFHKFGGRWCTWGTIVLKECK